MDLKPYNEQEYNRLCAEFLGYEVVQTKSGEPLYKIGEYEYYLHKLKFHSDWNWIMEVRDKMFSSDVLDGSRPFVFGKLDRLIFDISSDKVKIEAMYWNNPHTVNGNHWVIFKTIKKYHKHKDHKEATVQAIWQFLNWYYEQKQLKLNNK